MTRRERFWLRASGWRAVAAHRALCWRFAVGERVSGWRWLVMSALIDRCASEGMRHAAYQGAERARLSRLAPPRRRAARDAEALTDGTGLFTNAHI